MDMTFQLEVEDQATRQRFSDNFREIADLFKMNIEDDSELYPLVLQISIAKTLIEIRELSFRYYDGPDGDDVVTISIA